MAAPPPGQGRMFSYICCVCSTPIASVFELRGRFRDIVVDRPYDVGTFSDVYRQNLLWETRWEIAPQRLFARLYCSGCRNFVGWQCNELTPSNVLVEHFDLVLTGALRAVMPMPQ